MSRSAADPSLEKDDPIPIPDSYHLAPVKFWSGPGKIGPSRQHAKPLELTPEQQETQKANAAARWAAFEEKANAAYRRDKENEMARKEKRKDLVKKVFGKKEAKNDGTESVRGLMDGESVYSRESDTVSVLSANVNHPIEANSPLREGK